MKNFIVSVLLLFTVACSCVAVDDKKSIQFVDGTTKTVYGLVVGESTVEYYLSKKDASNENNKVTVPLNVIKQIVDLEDE